MRKNILLVIGILLILGALIAWFSRGGSDTVYKEVPEAKQSKDYKPEILWPLTEADKEMAGEASGVAVDSKGDIFYLHRGSSEYGGESLIQEPALIVIDGETKEVKNRWGKNMFASPHGLEIDDEDNVWITDITLNKVYKFTPDGHLLATFGDDYPFYMEAALRIRNVLPNLPTGMTKYTFARPTDVTVMEDGSFAVSDGYRNRRIVKFDSDGNFLWEKNDLGNGTGEFNLPHGISHDQKGNLFVADRNNARVQVLNQDGEFLDAWEQKEIGRPFGVEVGNDGNVYLVDGGDALYPNTGRGSHQVVIVNKNGEIINRFGKWGSKAGEMKVPHDVAVNQNGDIFVAELQNNRLQVFRVKE
ncbi:peptidyl-alpha-hydroxyglycine alpha-amidating lyase family protein [uncultured Rossellomorea sp.]|uniref:peptidyl-alpha-hydroxyglycine alpha-amidating lyase family protein n=1 Tax=uncultured Rossellomorea sp. TaxID=2837549 RepID=UPI002628EC22|nr:peptidyl-alpha-hydroxyglycine alpha-amidating lyase family protein [uncultured Rossellomorea sp.]